MAAAGGRGRRLAAPNLPRGNFQWELFFFFYQLLRNKKVYLLQGAMLSTAAFKEITTGIQPAIFRLRSDKLLCGSRRRRRRTAKVGE